MIASWLIYASAMGCLIALVALLLERIARWSNRPTRWIWLAAIGSVLVLPIVLNLLPHAPAHGSPVVSLIAAPHVSANPPFDLPLLILWLFGSLMLSARIAGSALALRSRRANWIPLHVGSERGARLRSARPRRDRLAEHHDGDSALGVHARRALARTDAATRIGTRTCRRSAPADARAAGARRDAMESGALVGAASPAARGRNRLRSATAGMRRRSAPVRIAPARGRRAHLRYSVRVGDRTRRLTLISRNEDSCHVIVPSPPPLPSCRWRRRRTCRGPHRDRVRIASSGCGRAAGCACGASSERCARRARQRLAEDPRWNVPRHAAPGRP